MPLSLFPEDDHLGLLTDLYELTMAAGYYACGLADQNATFELWIRRLPECRNYLIAAGLEQVVHYLTHLRFAGDQIDYLRKHAAFEKVPADWFERLASLRFDGDLWAIPEGTAVFAREPLLRVTAPLMVAQIVETYLITTITFQTMVASKAARVVTAARGRPVVDFGSRRAHGPQAGLLAARASYIGGCVGTSNTEAARLLGIPALGTQAHAWIMAFDSEIEAFRKFGQVFPKTATMLIDTYDTIQGVRNALASGAPMQAVRLDSGDLAALSRQVRMILDNAGRQDVKIVASGDLNEYKIKALLEADSPIDVFGVGTEMVTSRDEPTLGTVYKLVEQRTPHGALGRLKMSTEKKTYPLAKQVYRRVGPDGSYTGDVIARATERRLDPRETPLLVPVLQAGRLTGSFPALEECRKRSADELRRLPAGLLALTPASLYSVQVSAEVEADALRLEQCRRLEDSPPGVE
jgi:nicotinate phosphoribosyltransferase